MAGKGGGFLHVFRFDPAAVAVPPRGSPLGGKYRTGALKCVMCRGLADFLHEFDSDHGDDCPGLVRPASGSLGTDFRGRA